MQQLAGGSFPSRFYWNEIELEECVRGHLRKLAREDGIRRREQAEQDLAATLVIGREVKIVTLLQGLRGNNPA